MAHSREDIPKVKNGDIWWCRVGENVGIEINGKSELFTRPVYIYKKLSALGVIVLPLTSQPKTGSWYCPFIFNGKQQYAALSQIRTVSVLRLEKKIGSLDRANREEVKRKLLALLE